MRETILPQVKSIKPIWSDYLKDHKKSAILSSVFLMLVLFLLAHFLQFIERRDGFTFTDPILERFAPGDFTWLTFALIYCSLIVALVHFFDKPRLLHTAVLTYAIMAGFRMAALYLLPLNPPQSMILLNDPVVRFIGSTGALTKDLFFSGHTSTLFMLYLVSRHKLLRTIFFLSSILVGISVLLQHVHYTVDVFSAPFFAFTAHAVSTRLLSSRFMMKPRT
ncbi:MAG: sphingomyelin synthase family protein [Planctomycetes bacterium]|nr:sphingomyelin synthase family protein [Planctomycetota bacterium]